MKKNRTRALLVGMMATGCTAALATAQSGVLDQESPNENANFNLSASSLTWQAQVRAGVDGQLEGVSMFFTGTPGSSQVELSIGLGDAWTSNIVFSDLITLDADREWQFIDVTSADIQLNEGDTFVIQTLGNDTGMGAGGSFVAPPDPPLYDEPLWLNESLFSEGWRHAFRTFMLVDSPCLDLSVSDLVGGRQATWTISGASPNSSGAVVFGFEAGETVVDDQLGFCATFGIDGVNQNRLVGLWTADGNGEAEVRRNIPNAAVGRTVFTQAAERGTCPDECTSGVDEQVVR